MAASTDFTTRGQSISIQIIQIWEGNLNYYSTNKDTQTPPYPKPPYPTPSRQNDSMFATFYKLNIDKSHV